MIPVIYADYEYYNGTYYGKMAEEDFKRLSRQASTYLDHVTFGRIQTVTDEKIIEKVKDACCAVADAFLLNETGVVSQETNDGISVTYVNGTGSKTDDQRLYQAAVLYLGRTGLMYLGVD